MIEAIAARIESELGPFPDVTAVHGLTFDGARIWACVGHALLALDPRTGEVVRALDVQGSAGTAFDGRHLYQLAGDVILKLDPETGEERGRIPAPRAGLTGLTWAEGSLWVGHFSDRTLHELDPRTGAILRTLESDRFVTGVTWTNGSLWHATWEEKQSEIRRIDAGTGEVQERIAMPAGMIVSGLEGDGDGRFFCGGGPTGRVRVVAYNPR